MSGGSRPQDLDDYLPGLVEAGMDMARVNLSHVPAAAAFARGQAPLYVAEEDLLVRIRNAAEQAPRERHVGVLLDLQGIKIRLRVPGGRRGGGLRFDAGERLRMRFTDTPDPGELACDGSAGVLAAVEAAFERDGPLLVAVGDGDPILSCVGVEDGCALLLSTDPGRLREGKGVMFRGVPLPDEPPLPRKDRVDLAAFVLPALLAGSADFVALSFTRSAADVQRLREFCADTVAYFREGADPRREDDLDLLRQVSILRPDLAARYVGGDLTLRVLAKIETGAGVQNVDEILVAADAVMVARGDLGLACAPEDVPRHQKNILHRARLLGRPVVVATQMLASMEVHPEPRRPEAADVFNAVLDGADALMLSGETAIGTRPVSATRTLTRIVDAAEEWQERRTRGRADELTRMFEDAQELFRDLYVASRWAVVTDRVTFEAVRMAEALGVRAIVAATRSGRTALHIARFHPRVPVVAVVPNGAVARSLAPVRSVRAVVEESAYRSGALDAGIRRAVEVGVLDPGDLIVAAFARLNDPDGVTSALTVRTAGRPPRGPVSR